MRKFLFFFVALVLLTGQAFTQGTPHVMWIPVTDFHYTITEGTPNTQVASAGTAITSEVSSFGFNGVAMTAADLVSTFFMWPAEYHNPLYPVAARIIWTSDSAGDDGQIDWLLDMEEKAFGAEDALETATVALADGISFAADTTEVQFGVQATAWDTFSTSAMQTYNAECLVEMSVELDDDGDASGDEPHLLGVQLYFVPRDFRGTTYNISGHTAHGTNHGIALPKRSGF